MCGRFTLHATPDEVAAVFGVEAPSFEPRYNITPSQPVATVRLAGSRRVFAPTAWGLIASWSAEPKAIPNARAERVASSPWFRSAFRRRRCLIPADGFYEWAGPTGHKQPYYYRLRGGGLFAFAGLWEPWRDLETSALITTETNDLVRRVHPRMPVMLTPADFDRWLDPRATEKVLLRLLQPLPASAMEGYPVSMRVNRSREVGPALIQPLSGLTSRR